MSGPGGLSWLIDMLEGALWIGGLVLALWLVWHGQPATALFVGFVLLVALLRK